MDVSATTVRRITQELGAQISGHPELIQGEVQTSNNIEQLITETDGTMIPIVEINSDQVGDLRKTRSVSWKDVTMQ